MQINKGQFIKRVQIYQYETHKQGYVCDINITKPLQTGRQIECHLFAHQEQIQQPPNPQSMT